MPQHVRVNFDVKAGGLGGAFRHSAKPSAARNRRLCLVAPNDNLRWEKQLKQHRRGCRTGGEPMIAAG
jgi:hypothetical protein